MEPADILERTRAMIREYAGYSDEKQFYCNRYVFARLQLDERKTKANIRKELLRAAELCYYCKKPFDSQKNLHLHRLNSEKGYTKDNCVLLHLECHIEISRESISRKASRLGAKGPLKTLRKESKRYEDIYFVYWWDITPNLAEHLDDYEEVEFVKKDCGQSCRLPVAAIKGFLIEESQTTRGQGNWGIRVFKDKPDQLAFEPGAADDWLFLSVVWKDFEL